MAADTGIEWTDATWNPIVGCSIVSPGCTNCYAMSMAARIDKMTLSSHYEGLTEKVKGKSVWTGKVALANPHIFNAPLRWRKPKRIFVNSMGDLFHEAIPDEWIDRVFAIMALTPRHSFQVLTKRAERMHTYMRNPKLEERIWRAQFVVQPADGYPIYDVPLPNVWLGVSAERQKEADERIEHLVKTPAAIRFVSVEPLLGPISFRWAPWDNWEGDNGKQRPEVNHLDGLRMLNWIIVGGESGHDARPMHPQWARDIRDECAEAGVPFFFKQWGEWAPFWYRDDGEPRQTHHFDGTDVFRIGKSAAGRVLDNAEHSGFPGQC